MGVKVKNYQRTERVPYFCVLKPIIMKTIAILLSAMLIFSCGGELSKEQKNRIRQSMQDGKIRRISPADLTEAAYVLGREITGRFSADQYLNDQAQVDAVSQEFGVKVFALKEGVKASEQALRVLDAYQGTPDAGDLKENIQKVGKDSILYTLPVRFERPDGSQVFSHAIAVTMPVKVVVRGME